MVTGPLDLFVEGVDSPHAASSALAVNAPIPAFAPVLRNARRETVLLPVSVVSFCSSGWTYPCAFELSPVGDVLCIGRNHLSKIHQGLFEENCMACSR